MPKEAGDITEKDAKCRLYSLLLLIYESPFSLLEVGGGAGLLLLLGLEILFYAKSNILLRDMLAFFL